MPRHGDHARETGRSGTVDPLSCGKTKTGPEYRLSAADGDVSQSVNWGPDTETVQSELDGGGSLRMGVSGRMPFRRTLEEAETVGLTPDYPFGPEADSFERTVK